MLPGPRHRGLTAMWTLFTCSRNWEQQDYGTASCVKNLNENIQEIFDLFRKAQMLQLYEMPNYNPPLLEMFTFLRKGTRDCSLFVFIKAPRANGVGFRIVNLLDFILLHPEQLYKPWCIPGFVLDGKSYR